MPKRQQDYIEQGQHSLYKRFTSVCQAIADYVALPAHRSSKLKKSHHHQESHRANNPEANTITERLQERTAHSSPPMTAFDIVVVGAGGGPDETNLSAYLVKSHPSRWEDGVLALEAGSAVGALKRILKRNPRLLSTQGALPGRILSASDVYNAIRCFLITHAHLDHINGLVVSAGSLSGVRKRIYGVKQTLDDIASVFNDRIWPNLASWKEDDDDFKLLYSPLEPDNKFTPILPDISVQTFPLNHGSNDQGPYASSAFFIRHDLSGTEFLFFGDVEPDSIAATPHSIHVWHAAAPKIPETLRAIFIECSWPSGRPDSQLYGHLTPEYLLEELVVLATEVRRLRPISHSSETHLRHTRKRQKRLVSPSDLRNVLSGLTVYVTHCKDGPDGKPSMREIIVEQIQALVEAKGLGCTVVGAEQGMHIQI